MAASKVAPTVVYWAVKMAAQMAAHSAALSVGAMADLSESTTAVLLAVR